MDTTEQKMLKVGDIVKCLDFAGIEDHYMIGKVYSVGSETFSVEATEIIVNGLPRPVQPGHKFTAPLGGVHFMDKHYPGRITVMVAA